MGKVKHGGRPYVRLLKSREHLMLRSFTFMYFQGSITWVILISISTASPSGFSI
jgi:hypothetical protein